MADAGAQVDAEKAEFFRWRSGEGRNLPKEQAIAEWRRRKTPAKTAAQGPSEIEALGRGAIQGATMGFADEIAGTAAAYPPRDPGDRVLRRGATPPRLSQEQATEKYRQERDHGVLGREANQAAEDAHGGYYLTGQIGGGLTSALIPGAGAAAGLKGLAAAKAGATVGAGYGTAAGLGGSKADLTKGEIGEAFVDTGIGTIAGAGGGVFGVGATKFIEKGRRAVGAALDKSKMVGALSQYLKNITTRNGAPEFQKKAAGQLMNEARKAAGDTPLEVSNFAQLADTIRKEGSALAPEVDKVILKLADDIAANKGSVTLGRLDNELQKANALVKDLVNNKPAHRIAVLMKKALDADLEAATGNKALGEAAEILSSARTAYAKGARADDLQKVIMQAEDAASLDKFISPRKFATLNSGPKRAAIERRLDDPKALEAWRAGVDAAKVMATKGDSWMPKMLRDALPPKGVEAFQRLMTYRNVSKIFSDPDSAEDFAQLVSPNLKGGTRAALDIITRISARLGIEPAEAFAAEPGPSPAKRGST